MSIVCFSPALSLWQVDSVSGPARSARRRHAPRPLRGSKAHGLVPWEPKWGFLGGVGKGLRALIQRVDISQVGLETLCLLHLGYTFNRKHSCSIKSRKQNHLFLAGYKEGKSLRWLKDGKEVIFYERFLFSGSFVHRCCFSRGDGLLGRARQSSRMGIAGTAGFY